MARFNIFHYLFAVVVALVLVANARPTSSAPDTGSVAGMPGMAAELQGGSKPKSNTQDKSVTGSEAQYMDDMEKALAAASKAAAKATPTTAGARPTPGVPTTAPGQPSATKPAVQSSPAASAPAAAAKPQGLLDSVPLVGGLAGSLPLPI